MATPRTLGKYIRRRFLSAILGTFVLCSVLIFMIDLVEMLRQSGKSGAVPAWKLAWITILRLPAYTEFLLAFAVLVGSIGALLSLSRKSELTVMRGGGMSAWQFLWPGMLVAGILGVIGVAGYNPMAASARAEGERLFAEAFGRDSNLLRNDSGGSCPLRARVGSLGCRHLEHRGQAADGEWRRATSRALQPARGHQLAARALAAVLQAR